MTYRLLSLKIVARDGFEPPQTEPKSVVLPLDDRAIARLSSLKDCKSSNLIFPAKKSLKSLQSRGMITPLTI
jgi:hypothetical protein